MKELIILHQSSPLFSSEMPGLSRARYGFEASGFRLRMRPPVQAEAAWKGMSRDGSIHARGFLAFGPRKANPVRAVVPGLANAGGNSATWVAI